MSVCLIGQRLNKAKMMMRKKCMIIYGTEHRLWPTTIQKKRMTVHNDENMTLPLRNRNDHERGEETVHIEACMIMHEIYTILKLNLSV